jgi:uncharacterized sulfatase
MKISKLYPLSLLIPLFIGGEAVAQNSPNLLIIQTDEHNFRTLGCYRKLMTEDQAFVLGKGIGVETPNLDRLASEGVICTNYYASSPVCTPSRASLQTGLHPITTGAPAHGMSLNKNMITFAEVLRKSGYQTNYIGKWCLSGVDHRDTIMMAPGSAFGYMDRTYQFETEHNKWVNLIKAPNVITIGNRPPNSGEKLEYMTDFLTNRCLELLERDKTKSFCMMLSIPDPHSLDIAKEPYKSQYANLNAEAPTTMNPEMVAKRPLWGAGGKSEVDNFDQQSVREYFGMVKCVDDNIGRILKYLDENKLSENTIVVFTSDHGDMLFEHKRVDKGVPYEASVRIPFLIRYPKHILAGKIIRKCYTTCDFAPTILGIMNANQIPGVDGINDAKVFLNNEKEVTSDRVIYMTDSPFNEWTAATDGRYKLVLSCKELPWLFDLQKDPSELVNRYSDPGYKKIAGRLQKELIRQMKLYKEPALDLGFHYCLSVDDSITYHSPYEGKSVMEIKQLEKGVIERRIEQIRNKCFHTSM